MSLLLTREEALALTKLIDAMSKRLERVYLTRDTDGHLRLGFINITNGEEVRTPLMFVS